LIATATTCSEVILFDPEREMARRFGVRIGEDADGWRKVAIDELFGIFDLDFCAFSIESSWVFVTCGMIAYFVSLRSYLSPVIYARKF